MSFQQIFNNYVLVITATIFLVSGADAFAQEVIDVTQSSKIEAEDPAAAKQLLMDQAIEAASFESIKGLIGEEKTERSKDLIKNKIIKKSDKYILSLKGMNVGMKISLKGLRALLLENGLLYQLEGPPKVLPVIHVVDRLGGRSYGWWYQSASKDHAFLSEQLKVFNKTLRSELQAIGFYTMDPIASQFSKSVPDTYRGENLQRADYLFLGEYFKSSIVVRGRIVFRANPKSETTYLIDVRLEALHSGNGRLMGEVVRTYETDPGSVYRHVIEKKFADVAPKMAGDLSAQLTEGWKKGTFGASIIKLAVVGKAVNEPMALEDFKKTVVLQVRDIKSLRERMIQARKVTYEIDSSALPAQLAQSLRTAKFTNFKVDVEDVSTEGITIKVESL
jgi:hypothetical protein